MGIKRGHLLRSIPEIPPEITQRLHELSISTAEELVGQKATDTSSLERYLGVSTDEFTRLADVAASHADPEFAKAAEAYTPVKRSYGARPPTTRKFEEIRGSRTPNK